MTKKSKIRVPSEKERAVAAKTQDWFCIGLTPHLSNIQLAALGTAFLRELAKRDGEAAAAAWCAHWADKIRKYSEQRYDA